MKARMLGVLVLAWVSGACITVSGGDPDQSVRIYVFEPDLSAVAQADGGTRTGVVLVGPPGASPGYDSRFMVYTEHPAELSHYAFAQWADSPSRMLEPLLVGTLTASERFAAVVDISAGVLAELRLDTELVTLRHEFQSLETSRVRIVLRAQVVQLRSRTVLATRVFEVIEPAPTNDARGGVIATNAALEELLRQVNAFVAQAAASRAPP